MNVFIIMGDIAISNILAGHPVHMRAVMYRLRAACKNIKTHLVFHIILLYNGTRDFYYDNTNLSKCVVVIARVKPLYRVWRTCRNLLASTMYDTRQYCTRTATTGVHFSSRNVRLIFSVSNFKYIIISIKKHTCVHQFYHRYDRGWWNDG